MGRDTKVIVSGVRSCGKTSILEQLIYGNALSRRSPDPTIEDIYCAQIESEHGTQERLRIFDTAGLDERNKEIPRHLLSFADAYVLVYSVTSEKSFRLMEEMKKDIDRNKERKDSVVVVLGNKADQSQQQREVDPTVAQIWAASEKVRLWEVTVKDRGTLLEPFSYIVSKLTPPSSKSSFHLKMTMRTKSDLAH